jgi:AraC-like DNA-binding protein
MSQVWPAATLHRMASDRSDAPAGAPEPTVSIRIVRQLVAAVERAGISPQLFTQAAQLDVRRLDDAEDRVLREELFRFVETALDLTGDPALGLHWGEWITANSFNLVSQLLAHAATLRQAFATLFQFGALLTDELNVQLIEREDEIELRVGSAPTTSPRVRRMAAEVAMLGFFRMLRDFDARAKFRLVSFEYPAPEYRDEYTRVFESAEQFDQPFTGLVFDRALMDAASPHKDEDIESSLRALAVQRVSLVRQYAPYSLRIRSLLVKRQTPHLIAIKTVAQWLELSPRSLHRRLSDEGQSYTAIANEAAAFVAKRLLADGRHTIQETAFAMGFSDPTAFHRAFKRWTGTTPTTFRDSR